MNATRHDVQGKRARSTSMSAVTCILLPLCVTACTASHMQCATPQISLSGGDLRAGSTVRVDVTGMWDVCRDMHGSGALPPGTAHLVLGRGDETAPAIDLGSFDADTDLQVSAEVMIPADSPVGPTVLYLRDYPHDGVTVTVVGG